MNKSDLPGPIDTVTMGLEPQCRLDDGVTETGAAVGWGQCVPHAHCAVMAT